MPSDPTPGVRSAETPSANADGGRAVDAVLLDVGGVFFLPDHASVQDALARAGVPEADPGGLDRAHYLALAAAERHPEARMEFMGRSGEGRPPPTTGAVRVDAIVSQYPLTYLRALGVPDGRLEDAGRELFALTAPRVPWTRVRRETADDLHALAGTGVRLAIVSNADGSVEELLGEFGICQVGEGPGVPVAAVVDSTVVGVAKPDPRIFEIALAAVEAPPQRTIHVGDSLLADVAGARAAGITPVHYDPFGLCPGNGHRDVAALAELVALVQAG
jgi:putative hydrolase of the HAD superfamily